MLTVFGDVPAPVVLPHDEGKDKPRTLLVKCLSKRAVRAWQRKEEAARDINDVDARDKAYDDLLAEVAVGWKNVDAPFSIEAISDAYTLPEFRMLLNIIPSSMVPGADDLKKSASPSAAPLG